MLIAVDKKISKVYNRQGLKFKKVCTYEKFKQ